VGQLYVEGDLRVIGTVEGGLEVTGSVEIDNGGRVTGPVTAHDRLVVGRAGSLLGDVRVARLVVADGATFSGKVSMGKQVDAPKPVELPAPVTEPVKAGEPVKAEAPIAVAEPVKAPEPVRAQPVKAPQPVKAQPAKPQQFQPKPPDRKGKRR
jgi:cytoskeletal protein CcmA (bactofilin family)